MVNPAPTSLLQFRVKRQITASLLRIVADEPIYVRFESEPYRASPAAGSRQSSGDAPKKEPPILARVTNLETGELSEIILGAVLLSELTESCPDGVTGLCFMIVMHKLEGKSYNTYEISEIEPE